MSILIFDTAKKQQQRWRASRANPSVIYLKYAAAELLLEPLMDGTIQRQFPTLLMLGARDNTIHDVLAPHFNTLGITQHLRQEDDPRYTPDILSDGEILNIPDASADLIISVLDLHWVNDLPGVLIQARKALKPGGCFMGALLGGQTLQELRHALITSETKIHGGVSPRISPYTEVKDCGMLLQRAGFQLPVTDSTVLTVTYRNVLQLLHDLRGMGETAALVNRATRPLTRSVLAQLQTDYHQHYATPEGHIPATFECITLTGWKD